MRTKYSLISFVALTLGLLCTASCTDLHKGKAVRFTGRTSPAWPLAKASYSGQTYTDGGKTYERIDWANGDHVMIYLNNDEHPSAPDYKDYVLSSVGASRRYSNAALNPAGGEDECIEWGTGTHFFRAVYPSTVGLSAGAFQRTIQPVQTLTYRTKDNNVLFYDPDMASSTASFFMFAGLKTPVTSDGSIELDFFPAVTTFEFTVGANTDLVITGFDMETTTAQASGEISDSHVFALTGDATVSFDGDMTPSFSVSGSTEQSIAVSFNPTAAISTSTSLSFKVFALPLDIQGVRIRFTLSDGSTRSLNLKRDIVDDGGWIRFDARSLVRITGLLVPGATWTISFDGPRVEQWTITPDVMFGVE